MERPSLSLLGSFDFDVASGDAPPALTKKARAMLAYLALRAGQPHTREKLASLLWGSNGEPQSRVNLRQALSTIRRAMPSFSGNWLVTEGESILLRQDALNLDVIRFQELAAGSAPDQLEQAIALYRGDLLDGFSVKEEPFEDWLRIERERLRGIAVTILERLVAQYSKAGDGTHCTQSVLRLLSLEPLREDMHRLLMRNYAAEGRVNLALKQFEVCNSALQRELGVQPEPETQALFRELKTRRLMKGKEPVDRQTARRRRPQTQYVKSAGCNIAYQVTGDGPVDLIYVPGWVSNLDYHWESPRVTHVFERLGSFCRLIRCDKRGTGLSDRSVGIHTTLEQRVEDMRAVLDAAGSRRTIVFGSSEGGSMCMMFAATYPERTAALVLNGAYARGLWSEDYPWAKTVPQMEEELAAIDRQWGKAFDLANASPSLVDDAFERDWFAALLRNSASPADALDLWRWSAEIDVREILTAIHVPTLIVQRAGDRWVRPEEGRYLAQHIAGARYLELPGDDHVIWGADSDRLVDEMQSFISALPPSGPSRHVLLAVLAFETSDGPPAEVLEAEVLAAEGVMIGVDRTRWLVAFQGPSRAIHCARAIRRRMEDRAFRAAVQIGECENRDGRFTGAVIQMASQLLDGADGGEIVVSRAVRDLLVGSNLGFKERNVPGVKANPGARILYVVV